ncbi:MAG: hypothetical protein RL720_865 [Actinomycetota bacterium]|jgi:hypothetical protein
MKLRSLQSLLAVSAAVPALVFGVGLSAAHAETSDAVTETIIDSSLSGLGTEVTEPGLLEELQQDVSDAIDAGIVDPAIIDAADPESMSPADSELENLIDENLSEETDTWAEEEPAWASAFETIRADFETCRTDGQSTSNCARTLGFQLQIAHAEAELAGIDAAIGELANLPEEDQAAALAELETQRSELQARLDRAATKLESAVAAGTPGANAGIQSKLNSVLEGVRSRALAPALPEQAQQNSQEGTRNGTGNAVVPEAPAQQGGSVTVDQAPGKSGNAGRPSNPGSQGKNQK